MNFRQKKNKGKSSSNINIYLGDIHSVTHSTEVYSVGSQLSQVDILYMIN